MASAAWVVSGLTVSVIGDAGAGATRVSVTPLITLETLLEALLMGTPSTVSAAFAPVTALVKLRPVVLLLTVISPDAPVVSLTRASRAPLASVITLARTPAPRLLMAAARPSRVLSVESTVTVTGLFAPTWNWKLPVARGVLLVATGSVK